METLNPKPKTPRSLQRDLIGFTVGFYWGYIGIMEN